MLIASDSNILEDEFNHDDPTKFVVIPSVIITKDFGDIIKNFYKNNNNKEKIVLSIKFSGFKENGKVFIDLFLRSDDLKASYFFQEFEYFKNKLKNKLKFTPIYKYSRYVHENIDNSLNENSESFCVKESHMCCSNNHYLNIEGRKIILENIRQSCIFKEFGLDYYWNYMISFSTECLGKSNFNKKCSLNILTKSKNENELNILENCMKKLIETEDKIESDYQTYLRKKVYSVPELYINGIQFIGNWYSKYIYHSICEGFLDDSDFCGADDPRKIIRNRRIALSIIFGLIFVIFSVLILSLLCYKRIINRDFEYDLNNDIQEKAMMKMSEYKLFKDNDSSDRGTKLEIAYNNL